MLELKIGNALNFWVKTEKGYDLTRGEGGGKPMKTSKEDIFFLPKRSALVIVDMQNYFVSDDCGPGRCGTEMVPAMIETVKACRQAGMPVVWLNMGFNKGDYKTIPPSYLDVSHKRDGVPFGESIGKLADGTDKGGKLARGSWNADLYGPLKPLAEEGIKAGTDVLLWKTRFSGLTGHQPLNVWLTENEITTTFFCGTATDNCVYSTFVDAYYLGYDCILVKDLCATHRPDYVAQTIFSAAEMRGWRSESESLRAALE